MPRRDTTPQDDEKRSYGALWLVMSLLLLVGALWAVADDNIFRRPWKKWQAGFNRLEISRVEDAIGAEDQRLAADPAHQEAAKQLAAAQAEVSTGETAKQIAALQRDLDDAVRADQSKDLNLRFIKSELEELRFLFDDAKHHGRPTDAILERIQQKSALQVERQKIYSDSQGHIEDLRNQIKAKESAVKTAEDALAKLGAKRDELQQKLENISLGRFPGPSASPPFIRNEWQPKYPQISQVVLEGFDRNAFKQPVARVDRCTSCHSGINKPGFEDQPNPWKTHPKRELFLGKHDPDKFGCTPCHNGDGTAVNSDKAAHCSYYDADGELHEVHLREEWALFRGPKMQANCIKCHPGIQGLEGAPVVARGEKLFVELGCHGCHLAEGYEDTLQGERRDRRRAVPAARRSQGRPRLDGALDHQPARGPATDRMPNFMFSPEQAEKITAYLLSTTKDSSAQWLEANPDPGITTSPELAAKGRQLMDTIGCRACHALAPDEVAGHWRQQGHRAEPVADRRQDGRPLDLPLDQEPARLLRRRPHAEPAPLGRRGACRHRLSDDAGRARTRARRPGGAPGRPRERRGR